MPRVGEDERGWYVHSSADADGMLVYRNRYVLQLWRCWSLLESLHRSVVSVKVAFKVMPAVGCKAYFVRSSTYIEVGS